MRKLLRRLLPEALRERIEIWLEQRRLARIPSRAIESEKLRSLSRSELDEIVNSEELGREWRLVEEELAAFGLPDRTGGLNPGDRRFVFQLVRHLRPQSILEVGTHIGISTAHISVAQKRSRPEDSDLSITTVDIDDVNDPESKNWLDYGSNYSPRQLLEALGTAQSVTFVAQSSLDYLAQESDETYDFVFLDGDHRAATVYEEVSRVLPRLRPGGVILLHDYYANLSRLVEGDALIAGPCLAAERLSQESDLEVIPLGRLPWPTTLGSHATNMALLSGSWQPGL